MKGEKLYTLIKDITKVRVSLEGKTMYGYKPAEDGRVEYNWYGRKIVHQPKPERWIWLSDGNEKYLIQNDNKYDWKEREFLLKEHVIDVETKKVTKKPYVTVQINNENWVTLDYFDTNEEALKFGQKILDLRTGEFI